jgi:hypothetical protein
MSDDDRRETASFKIADQKIGNLLKRLNEKNVCGCCTARAGLQRQPWPRTLGSASAIEMFEGIITALREDDVPAPDPMPSTEAH